MPDTRIDQSDSIPSIRLKVPTGTVPVPPVGFGQLHTPSPGVLALRLPDGSVIEVGPATGGGGSGVRVSDPVTVTSPELLALDTTPKVLVASPGAEAIIVPLCLTTRFHPGSTPYTVDPASQIGWGYAGLRDSWDAADTLDDGRVFRCRFVDTSKLDDFLETTFRGVPLRLRAGTWAVTDGDGTLTVTVTYMVV